MIEEKKQIDYSKFFEKGKEKEIPEKRKKFSLKSFKDFWSEADKKTKIEMIVFLVVVMITLGILIFYFSQAKPKIPQYLQPAEEQFIPGEEEFE